MILLALADVCYTLFGFLFSVVFPDIPVVITNLISYICDFVIDGLDILFYMFLPVELVTAMLNFVIALFGIFIIIDVTLMVINIVRGNY